MATEYRVFFLTHGQMPPIGTTSIGLSGGGIMWKGEEKQFPSIVRKGVILFNDKTPDAKYNSRLATEVEINEYNKIISGVIDGGMDEQKR